MGKIRDGELLPKVSETLRYGSCGRVVSRCNITTVRYEKKVRRTDWSGLGRTLVRTRFTLLYIAAERNFSLFGYLNL